MIFNIIEYINVDLDFNIDLIKLILIGIFIYLILFFSLDGLISITNTLYLFFIDFIILLVIKRINKYNNSNTKLTQSQILNSKLTQPQILKSELKNNLNCEFEKDKPKKIKKGKKIKKDKISKTKKENDLESEESIPLYNTSKSENLDTFENIPIYKKNISN